MATLARLPGVALEPPTLRFSPVVYCQKLTEAIEARVLPWKSTSLPKDALSVAEPVRMPRLPTPIGGLTRVLAKLEVGPERRNASPLPMRLRSMMLQLG